MKKIGILSLLVITSIITNAQENIKKCITTRLVEQELISNPDYTKGRDNSISENIEWINADNLKRSTINIPVVMATNVKRINEEINHLFLIIDITNLPKPILSFFLFSFFIQLLEV